MNKTLTAKQFLVRWLLGIVVFYFGAFAFVLSEMLTTGEFLAEAFSPYHIVTTAVLLLIFYPMLFVLRRKAKQENKKGILIFSRIMIAYFSLWTVLNVFGAVFELMYKM